MIQNMIHPLNPTLSGPGVYGDIFEMSPTSDSILSGVPCYHIIDC